MLDEAAASTGVAVTFVLLVFILILGGSFIYWRRKYNDPPGWWPDCMRPKWARSSRFQQADRLLSHMVATKVDDNEDEYVLEFMS